MPFAYQSFCVQKGAPWTKTFTWKTGTPAAAVDLTGATAKMKYKHVNELSEDADEITTEDGGITLGGVAGTVQLDLTLAQVNALTEGKYLFQIFVTVDGDENAVTDGAMFVGESL